VVHPTKVFTTSFQIFNDQPNFELKVADFFSQLPF